MVAMATHDWCYYSNGTVFLMSIRIQEQESGEIGLREPLRPDKKVFFFCVFV